VSRLFEALKSSADGAFVTDEDSRILFWNESAEAILGFDGDDVAGNCCYHLFNGCDEGGRLICKERCRVVRMALQSQPIPNYDVRFTNKQGKACWLHMSVFAYRMGDTEEKKAIVHLFHDHKHKEVDEKVLGQLEKVINRYHDLRHNNGFKLDPHQKILTSREREILALLAEGHGTQYIAQHLTISTTTVRNHIQHILQKLNVHTRLEAVAVATKHNLID